MPIDRCDATRATCTEFDPRYESDRATSAPPVRVEPDWSHAPLDPGRFVDAPALPPKAEPPSVPANLSAWTSDALDRESDRLRRALGRPVDYVGRETDEATLNAIEAEQTKRQGTDADRRPPKVELCKRVADLPGNEVFGVEHWWLKTRHVEAGMGPEAGNVPGHGGCDLPGDPTKIVDHSGQSEDPGAHCEEVLDVDEACVDRHLEIDRATGPWLPWNQCHTVVRDILDDCAKSAYDPSDVDAGAPR